MLTLEKLKQLRLDNRNSSVIYKLLSTIVGECEQISKNPTNNEILGVLQKVYKSNLQTIEECLESRPIQAEELQIENRFIAIYLPKNLTNDELTAIIQSQVSLGFKMPQIMKYLSENYKGRYDGKVAVKICNLLLNGTII